jgi:hypothetical protein
VVVEIRRLGDKPRTSCTLAARFIAKPSCHNRTAAQVRNLEKFVGRTSFAVANRPQAIKVHVFNFFNAQIRH